MKPNSTSNIVFTSNGFSCANLSLSFFLFTLELCEDWASLREPVIEGVPFYVKYLGSSLVQKASGEEATADAIKTIITMVSELERRLLGVSFQLRTIKTG